MTKRRLRGFRARGPCAGATVSANVPALVPGPAPGKPPRDRNLAMSYGTDTTTQVFPDDALSTRHIEQLLGLSRSTIGRLVAGGFVTPERGPRNTWRFSFRDVVILRVAHRLRAARIPTQRIMRSLATLRAGLPAALPLSVLKITALGDRIVVRRRRQAWDAESGQYLFELDLDSAVVASRGDGAAARRRIERSARNSLPPPVDEAGAIEAYVTGEALEGDDRAAAEHAYRRALALDPSLLDASLNLSALLCESGRPRQAEHVLDAALNRHPDVARLHYNRAVAIDKQGRRNEAIVGYRAALLRDARLADAHRNVARLYRRGGDHERALSHLRVWRKLLDSGTAS